MTLLPPTRRCAYCGCAEPATRDHVVSNALYPVVTPQRGKAQVQRITVPACKSCNEGWSGDEAHFRDTLLLAGDPTPTVWTLWEVKARASFLARDGHKRVRDLADRFVATASGRHMIYPGRDERVMRIVRKTVRGLCCHHKLRSTVFDGEVWADVQRFAVPPEWSAGMQAFDADADVLKYQFGLLKDDPDMESFWALRFFGRTPFHCIVYRSVETRKRSERHQAGALR
ncbi:MAG: hypothetical protein WDN25_29565 [Acetobacteraceae bacterium]